ncbi:hypothetical protein Q31b_54060 [Novipirellula aureliae]|uniref:Chromosome partition protein Smc n=1 Tax=Novipirellula aureliae TaxID=2527966 RepID=A0A5C6DEW9_9BACT|nr:hypothetical protein [Novipirellula aureliae]TWU35310.1 hypothetical protein Q31b_54060 [Novipirellula aureliae]
MPISGPVVHRQLIDAYNNAQARLEQARAPMFSNDDRENLQDRRGEALVTLAEYYLPQLSREAILSTWPDVRSQLAHVLRRKESKSLDLHNQLDEANRRRHQFESELISLNTDRDRALERMQEIADEVETELQKDPDFVKLADRAALAEAALERAEGNLQEVDQDAARKLPAFERSDLFQYLRKCQFGTPQYARRGVTRRIDRWLARYIGFREAKQSYDFLKKTPEQMREIIAQDREAFDVVMEELEKHRDRVARRLGLPDMVLAIKEIERHRDANLKQLERSGKTTQVIESELIEIESLKGPYYTEAIQVFRKMLEQMDTGELDRRAQQTPDLTDDQIVARLAGVDSEFDKLKRAATQRQKTILHTQQMMEALGSLIGRFRALQFDSSRSQFVGTLNVTELLYQAENEEDVEAIWEAIRSAQRWGPTTTDTLTNVATHPMTQVLLNAMAHAAGSALASHARRAGERHQSSWNHRQRH